MALVAVIVGSPVGSSASAGLGSYVQNKLEASGHTVVLLDASSISSSVQVFGGIADEDVVELVGLIAASDGVVVTTPVQTDSYSGVLNSLLDILPSDVFTGKALVPLATGVSNFDASALDNSLLPVLRNLGARHIVSGAYVLDRDIVFHPCEVSLADEAEFAVDTVLDSFVSVLGAAAQSSAPEGDWTSSVSAERAFALARDGVLLIDVRSNARQPGAGVIDSAVVVPKTDIEERFGEGTPFDPDEPVLVFCNGALGSRPVALRLEALGFKTVRQVRGGFAALEAEQARQPVHR